MAREINYELSYPKFSIFNFPVGKLGLLGDKILLTKAKCWEHEAEWLRLVMHKRRAAG